MTPSGRWRTLSTAGGIGLLALLTAQNTLLATQLNLSIRLQLLLYMAGVVLLALPSLVDSFAARSGNWLTWREAAMLTVLFAAALGLRLAAAAELRMLVDELNTMGGVLTIWKNPVSLFSVVNLNISPYPWHYMAAHEIVVSIFGRTLLSLRALDAAMGAFSVLLAYALGRTLFDRRIALTGAALLVTLPTHLQMTRIAVINVADVVLLAPVILFLARGLKDNRRGDFVLAGIAIGLTQAAHEATRLVTIPLVLAWLVWGFVFGADWIKNRGRNLLWLAGAALVVSLPMYITWAYLGAPIAGRLTYSGMGTDYWLDVFLSPADAGWLSVIADNVGRAFLLYIAPQDGSLFYAGQSGLVLLPLVPFFLIGVLSVLIRPKSLCIILPLSMALYSLGNGLLVPSAAVYVRFLGLLPGLVLLVAAGLVWAWDRILNLRWFRAHCHAPLQWIFPVVILLIVIGQGVYFFAAYIPYYNRTFHDISVAPAFDDAVVRAAALPRGVPVFLLLQHPNTPGQSSAGADPNYSAIFLNFLVDGHRFTTVRADELTDAFLESLPAGVPVAFFVAGNDAEIVKHLQAHFTLLPPIYTENVQIPQEKQFVLYNGVR